MTDHALPVTPEAGDAVTIRYRSRRSRGGDGYNHKERSGTVERVATYRDDDGNVGHGLLVREDDDTYLVAGVRPDGHGSYVYSVNFDTEQNDPHRAYYSSTNDDDAAALEISEFYVASDGAWTLSWENASKTQRVALGRVLEIRLTAVGD